MKYQIIRNSKKCQKIYRDENQCLYLADGSDYGKGPEHTDDGPLRVLIEELREMKLWKGYTDKVGLYFPIPVWKVRDGMQCQVRARAETACWLADYLDTDISICVDGYVFKLDKTMGKCS